MADRTRAIDAARRSWERRILELGDELRTARRLIGATQRHVGTAIGISHAEVSRRERGRARGASVAAYVDHAAAVGLRLSIKTFPVGGAVRYAAQIRYTRTFLGRIGDGRWRVELEAPVPLPGDLRAVDVLLRSAGGIIAVEVITRLGDVQAQLRAAREKARDVGASRLVLAIAATHSNRRALDDVRSVLAPAFDIDTRRVLATLAAGRTPDRDAIVLI
jgi:transcriptional regulator with XRE-family HTH domain